MDLAVRLNRVRAATAGACGGGVLGAAGALSGMPRYPKSAPACAEHPL